MLYSWTLEKDMLGGLWFSAYITINRFGMHNSSQKFFGGQLFFLDKGK